MLKSKHQSFEKLVIVRQGSLELFATNKLHLNLDYKMPIPFNIYNDPKTYYLHVMYKVWQIVFSNTSTTTPLPFHVFFLQGNLTLVLLNNRTYVPSLLIWLGLYLGQNSHHMILK